MSENKRYSLTKLGGYWPDHKRRHRSSELINGMKSRSSVAREVRYQRDQVSEKITERSMSVDQSIADPRDLDRLAFALS